MTPRQKRRVGVWLVNGALVVTALVTLFPLFWMVLGVVHGAQRGQLVAAAACCRRSPRCTATASYFPADRSPATS